MSYMSLPPLQFVPTETSALADLPPAGAAASGGDTFAWPTPPLACYPAPVRAATPEVCEIEGLNGKTITGRLMHFNPAEALVKLRVTHAKSTISLRFDQFRRLRLMQPLAALPSLEDLPQAGALSQRPTLPFKVQPTQGAAIEGLTIGHLETDYGLFVYEPLDLAGTVRRAFFPRASCPQAHVGQRIGELLVAQAAATPAQVQDALAEQRQLRTQRLGDMLAATGTSPSQRVVRHEKEVLLAQLLERLPHDYREVIILRHLEGLPHDVAARRLGRQPGAVRMLWVRALARLREEANKAGLSAVT